MKRLTTQFLNQILPNLKPSLDNYFISLIILGIPLNLYKNRFYDDSWTIGEWLISYAGGFVRRGLPGQIIHHISNVYFISPILLVWLFSVLALISLAILIIHSCKDSFQKSFLLSQLIEKLQMIIIHKNQFQLKSLSSNYVDVCYKIYQCSDLFDYKFLYIFLCNFLHQRQNFYFFPKH